eukprot:gnl/MRDRNA2_/MRDRNA2_128705_c0_seq1.p1 gnl/MRDRNA2_/MRDRNA2_128705_c0~~gnl/MRDRNA2_/MRDRNA2_128705_c0_seq1.p1  ORF type:complete len:202 (+),score=68.68 gnl/MRDRNA2_/MRDRNA2_128705_c0_seq1:84-689(+)
MAAAAAVAVRRSRRPQPKLVVDEKRLKQVEQELQQQKKIHDLMHKYDTDKSGKLNEDQMRKLLTDLDSSTPPNTPPSEEELRFVIKLVDKENDGCVDRNEILYALRAFAVLTKKRTEIEEALSKFDKSGTGKLEPPELKAYLTSLNGGIEVDDDEVQWVLSQADIFGDGAMSKPELVMATSAWYVHIKKEEEKKQGCCTIQ